MTEVSKSELQEHVERLTGSKARIDQIQRTTVSSERGDVVWRGVVHLFTLENHPDTDTCFAWSAPIDGTANRKFYAVLKVPPIKTATDAVSASIVADHKSSR
jgi:hypothetical protein